MLQSFLGGGARGAVAHSGPGGQTGNQNSKDGSEDQDHPGLVPLAIGFRHTDGEQAHFFRLHLVDDRLELIIDLVVRSEGDGGDCRVDALVAADTDDHVGMGNALGGQGFNGGKMNLLYRVVHGEGANRRLLLPGSQDIGPICSQVGFLAGEHEAAAAGFDVLHGKSEVLYALDDSMRVPHPPGALIGDDHPTIGERPH